MSDNFQLTVEFPYFAVIADPLNKEWVVDLSTPYYSRMLGLPTAFYNETTIDLSGRTVLKDETVFFRSSFEQKAGYDSLAWKTSVSLYEGAIELTIISSVPMTQENLIAAVVGAGAGFTATNFGFDPGNFDRSVIIHGRNTQFAINTVTGHTDLTATGAGYLMAFNDNYFSSLEPTAADTLYCYRVINLSDVNTVGGAVVGANVMTLNAKRVILDCMSQEEPTLEYMMRLKRSYELANQV